MKRKAYKEGLDDAVASLRDRHDDLFDDAIDRGHGLDSRPHHRGELLEEPTEEDVYQPE